MSKNRPFIPPPRLIPPGDQLPPAAILPPQPVTISPPPEPPAPALSVVRPAREPASWAIHADRVEFINPIIDLAEAVWLKHEYPHQQTRRLEPARAVVAHGLIFIEALGLAIPLAGASIRTAVKERA